MTAADLRQLTMEELEARIRELRRSLFRSSIQHTTQQLENTAGLRTARRELARALTVQVERKRLA